MLIPNTKLYGELFIDDLYTSRIGSGWWGDKTAWLAGALWADAFTLANLDLRFEYARARPYVYTHIEKINTWRRVPLQRLTRNGTQATIKRGQNSPPPGSASQSRTILTQAAAMPWRVLMAEALITFILFFFPIFLFYLSCPDYSSQNSILSPE